SWIPRTLMITYLRLHDALPISLMALSEGEIFGPYFENGAYKLTKVVEKKRLPDSVTVRHILVRTENAGQPVATDEAARARLDSRSEEHTSELQSRENLVCRQLF